MASSKSMTNPVPATSGQTTTERSALSSVWLDVGLVFVIFFLYAFSPPPSANEAHYLAKAKHYWNPSFCPRDHFLNSADAHAVFYWTFGWLTLFFSLPVVAWIGRLLTWGLLAWSWQRFNAAICPTFGFAALSAGLFVTLLHWGHMAGEWVIGGVEAKGFAYVLVFLALEAALKNRWPRMILLLGAATSFHVLVGGWSLVAATMAWAGCGQFRPPWKTLVLPLLGAVVLSLPGLIPALAMSMNADAQTIREANEIHVYGRLGHHLLFHRFLFDASQPVNLVLRHVLLLIFWVVLAVATPCQMSCQSLGQRPLRGFVGGAVLIAIVGAALDQFFVAIRNTTLPPALLKYYWFRLSDAMLPLGVAIAYSAAIPRWQASRPVLSKTMLWLAIGVILLQLGYSGYGNLEEMRRGASRFASTAPDVRDPQSATAIGDWRAVCRWIHDHTPPTALFLTPRSQQTFKWYAERSEIATRKDVPQDPRSVVEWYERMNECHVGELVDEADLEFLHERIVWLQKKYGFEYVVVDQSSTTWKLPGERIYPTNADDNRTFAVYKLDATSNRQD